MSSNRRPHDGPDPLRVLARCQPDDGKRHMNGMKTPLAILVVGLFVAVAIYVGLADDRRGYMKGCMATLMPTGQSEQDAEATCAIHYKR